MEVGLQPTHHIYIYIYISRINIGPPNNIPMTQTYKSLGLSKLFFGPIGRFQCFILAMKSPMIHKIKSYDKYQRFFDFLANALGQ